MRRRCARCLSIGAAIVATPLACARAASAASPTLAWSAPDGCPSATDVRARLDAVAGAALAGEANADVTVTRERDGRFAARVHVQGAGGEGGVRALEEATCDLLADAVVTVIAMALVPAPPTRTQPAPPEPPPASPASRPVPERASPHEPSRAPLHFAAGVVAELDGGTLPRVAVGAGVAIAGYPTSSLRVEAAVVRWLSQTALVPGEAFGGTFQLTTVDVRACWSPLAGAIALGPCAGIDLAHIDATGYLATTDQPGTATWWGPSVGAFAGWHPVRHLAVGALVDVGIPLERHPFVIQDGWTIYTPAIASVRGRFGLDVLF